MKRNILFLIIISIFNNVISVAENKEPKTILIVSGWQDVNIGDIAHTSGLLHILETFIPEATVIFWERSPSEKVDKLLLKNYPNLKIVQGDVDKNKDVNFPEVLEAFKKADIMIHGSVPYVVAQPHLEAWVKYTNGKPFGIFGTTIEKVSDSLKDLLLKASFIYTRETKSIAVLKNAGITGKHIDFVPDATFFLNLHDDATAIEFLKKNNLEERKYICVIPRLRYTPYYLYKKESWTEKGVQEIDAHNNRYKEIDHAKLREAIIDWVRSTKKSARMSRDDLSD